MDGLEKQLGLKYCKAFFLYLQGVVKCPLCTIVRELYGRSRDPFFFSTLSLGVFVYF